MEAPLNSLLVTVIAIFTILTEWWGGGADVVGPHCNVTSRRGIDGCFDKAGFKRSPTLKITRPHPIWPG